jgi:hypothetical protein
VETGRVEVYAKNHLQFGEGNVKGSSGKGSGESLRENLNLLIGHISGCDHNAGRNVDRKGHFDEVSDGNEQETAGKGILPKNLAELCPCPNALWKAELTART